METELTRVVTVARNMIVDTDRSFLVLRSAQKTRGVLTTAKPSDARNLGNFLTFCVRFRPLSWAPLLYTDN